MSDVGLEKGDIAHYPMTNEYVILHKPYSSGAGVTILSGVRAGSSVALSMTLCKKLVFVGRIESPDPSEVCGGE